MSDFMTPTASLSSDLEVVLDLHEGFSKAIKLTIQNRESKLIMLSCQMFADYAQDSEGTCDGNVVLDLARALRLGMLEVVGQDGRAIPFNWSGNVDLQPIQLMVEDDLDLDANSRETFSFGRSDKEVLRLFRRHLNPDETYHLRFCNPPYQISWMYGEVYDQAIRSGHDPWAPPAANQNQLSYDMHSIPFTVIKGTRKPEFTMSLRVCVPVCDVLCPEISVSLCVTSLVHRSITVKLDVADFVRISPTDVLFRQRAWGLNRVFSLFNKSRKQRDYISGYPLGQRIHELGSFDPYAQLIQFDYGTTYTMNFTIPIFSSFFGRGDTYSLETKPQGFAAWDYGTIEELSKTHRTPGDWLKHGPIMFEPGSTIAPTIENIFERQRRGPFCRLPRELRQMVYSYLRYDEHGARVQFAADLPLQGGA